MTSPFALKDAQDQLKASVEAAVEQFASGEPLELDLSFNEVATPDVGALSDTPQDLNDAVRRLVHAFNASGVAKAGPVLARHVTAFDSDGDGQAVVTIRYSYAEEG